MYYLFKKDFMGNNIPVFAAQKGDTVMNFVKGSRHLLCRTWVPGNIKTLMGL